MLAKHPPAPSRAVHAEEPVSRAYRALHESGRARFDPLQAECAAALDRVRADALTPRKAERRFFFIPGPAPEPARGLYVYGPVGRGKSMLTELFLQSLPEGTYIRKHFHDFLRETHAALRKRREDEQCSDPVAAAAADVTEGKKILCFDEFQVHDIADAMLLSRLFGALFAAGVTLLATSNSAPDDLYPDGLQREHILPFIALLKERTRPFLLASEADYRRSKQEETGPSRTGFKLPAEQDAWEARLLAAAAGALTAPRQEPLSGGRVLPARAAEGKLFRISFSALCGGALGAGDYADLVRRYPALATEDIPPLGSAAPAAVTRFIHFIDVLYEAKSLFLAGHAEASPEDCIPVHASPPPGMARCLSRLSEMRSTEYISYAQQDHRPLHPRG